MGQLDAGINRAQLDDCTCSRLVRGDASKRAERNHHLDASKRSIRKIDIMREVISEGEKPVMLYSVGKDSAVMLHLARKAFYPAPRPFHCLHVDTTWKFRAMYEMRDQRGATTAACSSSCN